MSRTYKNNGKDSDDLDLWHRQRRSRAEIYHQKMSVSLTPFGFGIEISHYLQLILAYFYNISVDTSRCDEPDFGHFMLHLEDQIQLRIQYLWGVNIFKNHINLPEHEPLDFMAVGVGILSFDDHYVIKRDPEDGLTNDHHFAARRMYVKHPPWSPSSKQEFGMIKLFLVNDPWPKETDI